MSLAFTTQNADSIARIVGPATGAAPEELQKQDARRHAAALSAHQDDASSRVAAALAALERADAAAMDGAEEALSASFEELEGVRALDAWKDVARDWMVDRPTKAALVLDVAVMAKIAGLDDVVTLALEHGKDEMLLRVAGQRARHVQFMSEETRRRAWNAFTKRLGKLRCDPAVLPSAAHLGRKASLPFLLKQLASTPPVAEAAASGLHDLASQNTRPPARLSDPERAKISTAAIKRLRADESLPSVIWLLGSVGTPSTLRAIAESLVRAFVSGRALEAAAAVRAGAILIGEDFASEAITALQEAIRSVRSEEEPRFMRLIVKARSK